jgi:hypothetical protein
MSDEAFDPPVENSKKLNKLKGFRIPSRVANGSPPIGWTRRKHNLSGFQQLRASEPKAL